MNLFTEVKRKLLQGQEMLRTDRRAMAARWEYDDKLKDPQVMKKLEELSEHMRQVEDGISVALKVIARMF